MKEIDPHLPVDLKAKEVVSKSNEKGTDYHPGSMVSNSRPLPTVGYWGPRRLNHKGKRIGRLIVINPSATFRGSSGKGIRWVVKCLCGRYEIRTCKSIRKNRDDDKCIDCRKTENIRVKSSKVAALDLNM